ncbi:hypothetical protein R1flu_001167 [Riccia fluitans]|uniref:Uncharacterized protein n=1 Tax=Riccia fluitans TaxID=41844 RepID=A0ABD1Y5G5_9MARC
MSEARLPSQALRASTEEGWLTEVVKWSKPADGVLQKRPQPPFDRRGDGRRYRGESRVFTLCDEGAIENASNFLLGCETYATVRKQHLGQKSRN